MLMQTFNDVVSLFESNKQPLIVITQINWENKKKYPASAILAYYLTVETVEDGQMKILFNIVSFE